MELKLAVASLFIFSSLLASSYGQRCSTHSFTEGNRVFRSCNDLPVLNSFLHWNYDQAAGTLDIAYRQQNVGPSDWVAWAINPTGRGMRGAQSLVAHRHSNGTMRAYQSPVQDYNTRLPEGRLSFDVSRLSATFANNEITIFATLGFSGNTTTVNQVWQHGPLSGGFPSIHPTSGANLQSSATLNLLSGQSETSGGAGLGSRNRRRNIHGVLNAISWGVLMPMGAIIARYMRVFESADPAWFYLHVACQSSAYVLGVAGWGTGLKLGSESQGINHSTHRTLAIVLFCLGTLQVFALLLRPKKEHKYRMYWNIYHHSIGYGVIALSIVNIFKGFDILNPENKWKNAYIGVIATLGGIAVLLEAFTWIVVLKRKKSHHNAPKTHSNGVNGANGYAAGHRQSV